MGEYMVAVMKLHDNPKSRCGVNCDEEYGDQFFHLDLIKIKCVIIWVKVNSSGALFLWSSLVRMMIIVIQESWKPMV